MPTHYRHYGSLTKALRATPRNQRAFAAGHVRYGVDGYFRSTQAGTGQGIPVDTGSTRNSARVWVGRPALRAAKPRYKGAHYPARPLGEGMSATRGFKLGQRVGVSVDHPGGILARNLPFRSGPRAGQIPSKKVPAGVGFHGLALEQARRYMAIWVQTYRPEAGRR